MRIMIIMLVIVFTLYLLDKVGLWLERKGWLYYRHLKPKRGGVSGMLQELNALLLPSDRHIIEMKKNQVSQQKSKADAASKPPDHSPD